MLKRKNIYRVFLGISLLLFVQLVIPFLHNHHSDRDLKQGFNKQTEQCMICALDIVPADFILPEPFAALVAYIIFSVLYTGLISQEVIFAAETSGRAPPVALS
ncbi:MAG: hypothetical protein ACTHJT_00455 [Cytophaga sp.]|uniref:hypothetical protein n=1 Tax=Cytophaga sp. TaxID=29535 RepID=UPI003F7DAAE8